jgi:hypothetical protein
MTMECELVTWRTKRVESGPAVRRTLLDSCYAQRASVRNSNITGTEEHFLAYCAPAEATSLTISRIEKHGTIFDEKHSPESVYVVLSGVARITCRNRKGDRTLVIMVAPGMIPGFPPPVPGDPI